jgi:hypothetical protein
VPSSSKKWQPVLSKTNEVKADEERTKQVDEEGEIIESTSVTYVGTDVIGKYISQYKDIAMSNMKITVFRQVLF